MEHISTPNLRICEFNAIFKRSTFLNWESSGWDFISCIFANSETYVMNNSVVKAQLCPHLSALCSVIIIDSAHTDRQLAESGWSERCSSQHWQQQQHQQPVRLMCGNKGRPKESFLVLNVHEDRWIRRQWMRPLEAFLQYRERSKARSQTLSYYYGRYQNKAFGRQRN